MNQWSQQPIRGQLRLIWLMSILDTCIRIQTSLANPYNFQTQNLFSHENIAISSMFYVYMEILSHLKCLSVLDFVVCGDAEGNMWFNRPPELSSWSKRKPVRVPEWEKRVTDMNIWNWTFQAVWNLSFWLTLIIWANGDHTLNIKLHYCKNVSLFSSCLTEEKKKKA